MKKLSIDIETYSDIDIKYGVYRYTDTPSFEILLFAYAVDGGDVEIVDFAQGETLPKTIAEALHDPTVIKQAFNAQFERIAISKYIREYQVDVTLSTLNPKPWHCTMVHAIQLGLPGSLKQCAKVLNVDQQKDSSGTQLINFFSKPCKPTKANGMRTRNLPEHDPEKWELFKEYCRQDVRTEMAIEDKLTAFPVKDSEWTLYQLDQQINDRGVAVDTVLAESAVQMMNDEAQRNMEKLKDLTGLENPNSLKQFKGWLADQGHEFKSLGKDIVKAAIKSGDVSGDVKTALELRLKTSMSSTKKYTMMDEATCSDGRLRGLLQFYGANRTGRWAGRLLQVQNLPRNKMEPLDLARTLVKQKDTEAVEWIYDSVPDTLKQLIRTGLIAKEGHTFYVSDFSAIEARVLAWYAGEKWAIEAFSTHGKIYEATASQMFKVPLEEVDSDLRQKGKVATLALGYQGSVGALKAMGALEQGLKEDELQPLVDRWRQANKQVVQFWYDTQKAAIEALDQRGVVKGSKGLKFFYKKGFLFIQLPSGRKLAYAKARLEEGKYGPQMVYEGKGDKVGFSKLQTYGGKLVENIVQATARDLLAEAMLRLDEAGYPIVFHVHDEAVAEVSKDSDQTIDDMNNLMAICPDWAAGLPLGAEGFVTDYYKKD